MRPVLLLPLLLLASPRAPGDGVLFVRDGAHLSVLRAARWWQLDDVRSDAAR